MPRKFRLFGNDFIIGKRLFGIGKEDDYYGMVNLIGNDRKTFNRLDAYRGLVYACINRIAETYATYQPYVERKMGRDWKALDDHEIMNLLHRPGGTDDKAIPLTLFDTLYATASFIELQGNCYWYLPSGSMTGRPREIIVLRADKVGTSLDSRGEIDGFYVRTNGGAEKIPLEIHEVLPFIGFNPKDPYKGMGTTEAAADYIKTDEYSTKFTKNFFKNNAGLSGVLTIKGEVERGAFRKIVRAWREKYQGVDNAGKVMMVRESDAHFEKVGMGLDQLDMTALRKMSIDDICLMFGVPKALIGLSDQQGLGRASVETFEYIFAKYVIEPKMKRLDSILTFALERYYGSTDLRMCHEAIIPEDKEYELAERVAGVDKWVTRNEIRAEDGDLPLPGGDQLFVPVTNLPLSESENLTAPSASTSAGFKPITLKVTRHITAPAKKKDSINSVSKENFRVQLMRNQIRYERRYKTSLVPVLKEQLKEVLFNLEAHSSSLTKEFNQKLFDDGAYDEEFIKKLKPVLIALGEEQGAIAMLFAGDTENDFRMTAPYEQLLAASTRKFATNFNDETLDKLNKTLADGIQNGENLDQLKERVHEVYAYTDTVRAERVARTETLKASNSATNEAYRQTGYVTEKEWYVNPDSCPQCAEFDGKVVGLEESFIKQGESFDYTDEAGNDQTQTITYDDVDVPPLHPNCRCTIIPVR